MLPAAGLSQRMGQNKLLLPWRRQTVIEQVLTNWADSRADEIVLVLGPDSHRVIELCQSPRVHFVTPPTTPPDMKSSVRLGLDLIRGKFAPVGEDGWLLGPADMPLLTADTINRVITAGQARMSRSDGGAAICVARYGQRRGHPVFFPWSIAAEVFQLPADEGINAIVRRYGVNEVAVDDPGAVFDLDTPEDYERLCQREESRGFSP